MKRSLCVSTLAVVALLAATTAMAAAPSAIEATSPNNTVSMDRQSVLYSQMGNPTTSGIVAQNFEAAYDAYDTEDADDFTVTWADGWVVQQVHVPGFYTNAGGPATGANVAFYTDPGAGTVGSQVWAGSASIISDVDGDRLLGVTPGTLAAGDYWVAAMPSLDYAPYGTMSFWFRESVTTGDEALFHNPGDGFGNGPGWVPMSTVVTQYFDMSFEILGENGVAGPTQTPDPGAGGAPIPTMNTYGIFAMIAMLLGVAVLVFIRRR